MASNFVAPISVPDYFTELKGYNSALGLQPGGAAWGDYGTPSSDIQTAAETAQILPVSSLSITPNDYAIGTGFLSGRGNPFQNAAAVDLFPSRDLFTETTIFGEGPAVANNPASTAPFDPVNSATGNYGAANEYGAGATGLNDLTGMTATENNPNATPLQQTLAPLMRAFGLNTSPSPATAAGTGAATAGAAPGATASIASGITDFFKTITDPVVWQRIGVVVLGLVILLAALFLFGFGSKIEIATSRA